MKFGKELGRYDPEWNCQNINYKRLKKVLRSIVTTAQVNEDVGPVEEQFENLLKSEIQRVSYFIRDQQKDLEEKTREFQENVPRLQAEEGLTGAERDAAHLTEFMLRLDQFARMNGTAVAKILKKHDKMHRGKPLLPNFDFSVLYAPHYGQVLDSLNSIFLQLRQTGPQEAPAAKAAAADSAQDFERFTRKYWVRPDRVLELKAKILPHLPLASVYGDSDTGGLVSSVYFDSPDLDLYRHRLVREEGAIALRIRWYGEGKPKEVFVERKVHHESWVDETSVKSRFSLKEERVGPFLKGQFNLKQRIAKMRQQAEDLRTKGDLGKAKKLEDEADFTERLSTEIQLAVLEQNLTPCVRTEYRRVAFQVPGNAAVRISLDVGLCMFLERDRPIIGPDNPLHSDWCRGYEEVRSFSPVPSEVEWFPYAVLEVKLQAARPAWVAEIVDSDIVLEMHKFSKFMHGTAVLLYDQVDIVPWWINIPNSADVDNVLPPLNKKVGGTQQRRLEDSGAAAGYIRRPASRAIRASAPAAVPVVSSPATSTAEDSLKLMGRRTSTAASDTSRRLPSAPEDLSEITPLVPPVNNEPPAAEDPATQRKRTVQELKDLLKKVQRPTAIEPKTYLANERTFMNWMHLCVTCVTVGAALVSLSGHFVTVSSPGLYHPLSSSFSPVKKAQMSGLLFICAAIAGACYAASVFHFRIRRIEARTSNVNDFGDRLGPSVAGLLLLLLVCGNVYVYNSQAAPPCTSYAQAIGAPGFEVRGLVHHPTDPNQLVVVDPSRLAFMYLDTLRTRTLSVFVAHRQPPSGGVAPAPPTEFLLDAALVPADTANLYLLAHQHNHSVILQYNYQNAQIAQAWVVDIEDARSLVYIPPHDTRDGYFLVGTRLDAGIHEVAISSLREPNATVTVSRPVLPTRAMGSLAGLHFSASRGALFALLESSIVQLALDSLRPLNEWPLQLRAFGGMAIEEHTDSVFIGAPKLRTVVRMPFTPDDGPTLCEGLL